MKSIAIIGFGRFGQLLASLATDQFTAHIVESDKNKARLAEKQGYTVIPKDQLHVVDCIFLAVPMSQFEASVQSISPHVSSRQLIIDLCSVKVYPVQIMKQYLSHARLLGSHPMFGPDSASKGLKGLQVALCQISASDDDIETIRQFWSRRGVAVLDTTPDSHDKDTVYLQAFTYSIARIITNTHIPDITFKTRSFKDIDDVAMLSARDSEQLFHDMLFYNPYLSDMKKKFEASVFSTLRTLDVIEAEQHESQLFATETTSPYSASKSEVY